MVLDHGQHPKLGFGGLGKESMAQQRSALFKSEKKHINIKKYPENPPVRVPP